MATVYPFRALRPAPELAEQVASVPYDVVNRDEAKALAGDNTKSFLHVTKPEIDLPADTDPYGDAVYDQGQKALRTFVDEGILRKDPSPYFYMYALTMGSHRQTGVVLCASVEEYDRNFVRKHEYTRPDKENDRVRHMEALNAQTGTVFLTHKETDALAALSKKVTAGTPSVDITAPDGIRHELWVVDDASDIEAMQNAFVDVGPLYIADGHHRSAAASRVAAARRDSTPEGPAERFLAVSFPTHEMQILPYNRVVKDLGEHSAESFLAAVNERFEVSPGKPDPIKPHQFGMYLGSDWHTLTVKNGSFDPQDPVGRLDVSILQTQLVEPLLGITDVRRDKRIDFVGGIRGDGELEKRVSQGWAVAFKMHPTSIEDLLAIADAEEVMPPKSTWFEPKLRDGLFVHDLSSS